MGRSEIKKGDVITAEGGINLLEVYDNDSLTQVVNRKSFTLYLIYSDIYGNCWELNKNAVKQLSDCPE